ncbi:MAG: zinc ribbon domain-containing protein [Ramlibacter sp.]|nr:zinc ribbon domain-containing protein [Ramlibacter sp.]
MPIYAYKCGSCGHAKDILQKLSDSPLTQCPACGAPAFSKQVTAAGFQLKGSGWYATDFRNGSTPAPAADGAKEGAKPADGAKPAETTAKPVDNSSSPAAGKPDAPTASKPGAPAAIKPGAPAAAGD